MSHFEDEEHTSYFAMEKPDGGEPTVISRAALTLSTAGLSNSVAEGTPGFISDDYLSAIAAETDLTATELVLAGEWERVDGGYRVMDPQMQELAEKMLARQESYEDWPLHPDACLDHQAGPNSRGRCIRCGTPVS